MMDRREFLKIAGLGTAALCFGCSRKGVLEYLHNDEKYDFDETLIDDYDLTDNMYFIEVKDESVDGTEIYQIGTGFKHNGKILTAEHVIDTNHQLTYTPFGIMEIPIQTKGRKIYADGNETEVIKEVEDYDVALLDGGEEGIVLGDSDELDYGNVVALSGYSGALGKIVKTSRIASLELDDFLEMELKRTIKETPLNEIFLVCPGLDGGDSGGPVYAFRDGYPEVVGMNKISGGKLGGCHKINHIKEVLDV